MSGLLSRIGGLLKPPESRQILSQSTEIADHQEPEPRWVRESDFVEFRALLPPDAEIRTARMRQFLSDVSLCSGPLAFEIVGIQGRVWIQFACAEVDAEIVSQQLNAHFPEVVFSAGSQFLAEAWAEEADDIKVVIEFALAEEFMWPLAAPEGDCFVGLIGSLANLRGGESGIYQVIFTAVSDPWADHARQAVTTERGTPFFDGGVALVKATVEKTSLPLFGAVVRIAARSADLTRTWDIARTMPSPLRAFARPGGQCLVPLPNHDYPYEEHYRDFSRRQSRRAGMILNVDELIGFVHFPTPAVRLPTFARLAERTRPAPAKPEYRDGVCLGFNEHSGVRNEVWLSIAERVRHLHIIGGTGTGKTTLLFHLIHQDLLNGAGVAVLDPHGDLIHDVLGIIPPDRMSDVVLLDPSDEEFSVPFNILSAHSEFEKTLLASDLIAVFQRLSTSWGDQMNSVFQNAILAILDSAQGGTLADLRRFLLDPSYRARFLTTVSDPEIRYYWTKAFPRLEGNKSRGPILTRLEMVLSPKPIRYMVSQRENSLDFAEMMDEGKIFLAKLPQGQMGRENAFLLGSLLVSKIHQMAISRQRVAADQRRPFFCYIDEFQHFVTPSMTEILSGARKYGVGLVLAHQELRQLERDKDLASAVLSNPGTRIVFRVGDGDARVLAGGFEHFEAKDLQNLKVGDAICRIERADNDFNLSVPAPSVIDEHRAAEVRRRVIETSRQEHATPKADVEMALLRQLEEPPDQKPASPSPTPVATPVTDPLPIPIPPPIPASALKPSADPVPAKLAPGVPSDLPAPQREPKPPRGLGKGGDEHVLIQKVLAATAQSYGFRAYIEGEIAEGRRQSVDLLLFQDKIPVIACEICKTTTIDNEIENVRKCFPTGAATVAVISTSSTRLLELEEALEKTFSGDELARLCFHTPDSFIPHLQRLSQPERSNPQLATDSPQDQRLGFKMRRKYLELSPEETRRKEDEALREITATLSKPLAE